MSSNTNSNELVAGVTQAILQNYCISGVSAVFIYEYVFTIGQEVNGFILTQVQNGCECLLFLAAASVSALRIYTLNGRDWRSPCITLALGLIMTIINVYCYAHDSLVVLPPLLCDDNISLPFATMNKCVGYLRESYKVTVLNSCFCARCTIHFGVLFALNVIQIILWVTDVSQSFEMVIDFTNLKRTFCLGFHSCPTSNLHLVKCQIQQRIQYQVEVACIWE
ncbi:hypothetical protein AcV5_001522 [Taiwanofungus camphoratus]|nr:hypothetical protein AcV5_001522 [Antrodia cinnamomea]